MLGFLKKHLVKNSAERWDMKYASGYWDSLREVHELGHYSIIAGYFQYLKKGGSILDVGCGEGLLQERISSLNYSKYVGIDLSAVAIKMANSKADIKTEFTAFDMRNFKCDEQFDAIVFNESLYYVGNRLDVVKKYSLYLKKDGIFIFSNFENQNNKINWQEIEALFPKYDETKIVNKNGDIAICKVLVKHSP